MKIAIAFASLAVAIPCASAFFGNGFTLGTIGTTTTGTATSGLAITGLSAATATAAGLTGVLGAIAVGGALGGLAAAATRRGKRSAEESNPLMAEQFLFDSLAAVDKLDCGKRYICEVAATPIDQLTQEELTSLLLFQTSSRQSTVSGKALFDEAIFVGAISGDSDVCMKKYKSCPAVSSFEELRSTKNL